MDTTQLLKGVLDLAVLAVVRERDGYGYDVVRRLRLAGLEDVGDASVYGTLRRLDEGPHRQYYALPDAGRALLPSSTKTWRSFTGAMADLLRPDAKESA